MQAESCTIRRTVGTMARTKRPLSSDASGVSCGQEHSNQVEVDETTQENTIMEDNSAHHETILSPSGPWFHLPQVVRAVTKSIKSNFDGAYQNWSETPDHAKEQWFRYFKQNFKLKWPPELEKKVREGFEHKGQERLKDIIYKVRKMNDDEPVPWMSETVRKQLKEKSSQPEFKKKSAQFTKNRIEGTSGLNATPGHCQGSVSTLALTERMASDKKKLPKPYEVYLAGHQRKDDDGKSIFCDEKAREVGAKHESLKEKYAHEGVAKSDEEIFLEASGGFKKGGVYGLGNASRFYYDKGSSSSSKSTTILYTPSLVSQLENRLQEQSIELAKTKEKLHKLQQEKAETDAALADLKKTVDMILQDRCHCGILSSIEQPREPPTGGSGAQCAA